MSIVNFDFNLEIFKSGKFQKKKQKKIWKPDEVPEKKIIISNFRSKPLIVLRNMVKTEEILRFEENPEKIRKPD